jgi:hypothetical protein
MNIEFHLISDHDIDRSADDSTPWQGERALVPGMAPEDLARLHEQLHATGAVNHQH